MWLKVLIIIVGIDKETKVNLEMASPEPKIGDKRQREDGGGELRQAVISTGQNDALLISDLQWVRVSRARVLTLAAPTRWFFI